MATKAKTLSALFQQTTIDDDEILKACNATLKQSKGDLESQHIKLVALLRLDRYDDALRVLEDGGDRLKKIASVERAYALYKVGELGEAKQIAGSVSTDRGARHVEAQAVSAYCPKSDGRLMLTVSDSHTGLKTSPTLRKSTKSCLRKRAPLRTRKMTFESTVGLLMRSWNGVSAEMWRRRESQGEKTWRHSKRRTMRHVDQLQGKSLLKERCC